MRSIILVSALLVIALAALPAVSTGYKGAAAITASHAAQPISPAQTQQTPADGVRRITVEELRAALEKGTAIVVDVRSKEQYKAGHIKGALLIPGDEIANRTKELPKDRLIVFYCS